MENVCLYSVSHINKNSLVETLSNSSFNFYSQSDDFRISIESLNNACIYIDITNGNDATMDFDKDELDKVENILRSSIQSCLSIHMRRNESSEPLAVDFIQFISLKYDLVLDNNLGKLFTKEYILKNLNTKDLSLRGNNY